MKQSTRVCWSADSSRRRVALFVCVSVLTAAGGPALAESDAPVPSKAEIEEIEREMERMEEVRGPAPKAGGPITCGDYYCSGLYDDIILYTWKRRDGLTGIRVALAVEAVVGASSLNCLYDETIFPMLAGEGDTLVRETTYQWEAELQLARALGYEIQLEWRQSNISSWMVCLVERVIMRGPPGS